MFAMTVMMGAMVLSTALVGLAEIIRDLVLDYQQDEFDWFWAYPVRGEFSIPVEMQFFREQEDTEFCVHVEDGPVLYLGYTQGELVRIQDDAELSSAEGQSPVIIDTRSLVLRDIALEYVSKSWLARNELTRAMIY